MSEVRLLITGVDDDALDAAVAETEELGFEDHRGNDPVTAAIIVGAALAAGKLIMRLVNEFRGGTVIDVTASPVDVRRDRDLPFGFFMIIAKDGKVTVKGEDEPKDALERMVASVLELATNVTTETAKAAIKAVLGDDAEVAEKPADA